MNDRRPTSVPPPRTGAPLPGPGDGDREEMRELVRRALNGDEQAHAEIFKRYREKVFRIAWRFTRDADDAMDLTQTTFIKAFRSLGSYREESSFATWIARVATNCGIDWVRAKKREGQVPLDEAHDVSEEAQATPSSPRPGPAGALLDRELGRAIQGALADLSEKHRTVFVLHCVEGMPYQSIADTLRISVGTVMSRLFHARRYLRKSLAPYLGEARVRTLLKGQEDEADALFETPVRAKSRDDAPASGAPAATEGT